jgi:actin-like ATPase involved in cell morphogenesis
MVEIPNEKIKQTIKIVVSVDAIGCFLYLLPSDFLHPDQMFTPGGVDLIDATCRYLDEKHNLQVGRLFANLLLKNIGSVVPLNPERTTTIGTTKTDAIELSSEEIRGVIAFQIRLIMKNIREAIPSIASKYRMADEDMSNATILLRGEFSYLRGLDQRIQEATGLKVIVE